MKITIHGAGGGEVTGSAYLLETCDAKILIDCGLFQGARKTEYYKLGRMLVDGKKSVKIFGESIPVRASVHTFGGLSGHAGQTDLVRWIGSIAPSRPRVFLTHGEARGRDPLKRLIEDRFKLNVSCPEMFETIEI